MAIKIRTAKEIEKLRKSGQAAATVLQKLAEAIRLGISTLDLEETSRRTIEVLGGTPTFLGHRPAGHPPYPATICSSVNEEIVHGIPRADRILQDGDIVSVDVAVKIDGYHGDNAYTFPIGETSEQARKLLEVTRASLFKAIDAARAGNRLGDVSSAVQSFVENGEFKIIRELCGHGIGRKMWEDPQIPNFGVAGSGTRLRPRMVLALEPKVSAGSPWIASLDDGWGTATEDGALAAHFEHTVVILSDGPEVLTENPKLWG